SFGGTVVAERACARDAATFGRAAGIFTAHALTCAHSARSACAAHAGGVLGVSRIVQEAADGADRVAARLIAVSAAPQHAIAPRRGAAAVVAVGGRVGGWERRGGAGEPVEGPLPHVAGHVSVAIQVVTCGRGRADGRDVPYRERQRAGAGAAEVAVIDGL